MVNEKFIIFYIVLFFKSLFNLGVNMYCNISSFEGTIENDTSNYTINFYSETAGTFTGTITI